MYQQVFSVAQMVKCSPAMQETTVRFLGQEDPLAKGIASNPLQFSCLENPMDRADWRPINFLIKLQLQSKSNQPHRS